MTQFVFSYRSKTHGKAILIEDHKNKEAAEKRAKELSSIYKLKIKVEPVIYLEDKGSP